MIINQMYAKKTKTLMKLSIYIAIDQNWKEFSEAIGIDSFTFDALSYSHFSQLLTTFARHFSKCFLI